MEQSFKLMKQKDLMYDANRQNSWYPIFNVRYKLTIVTQFWMHGKRANVAQLLMQRTQAKVTQF